MKSIKSKLTGNSINTISLPSLSDIINHVKIIKNRKYSKQKFDDYEFRVTVEFEVIDSANMKCDLYTTETNKDNFTLAIKSIISNKVNNFKLINWHSKEYDKYIDDFITNLFK